MSASSLTLRGRRAAEALMTDRCRLEVPSLAEQTFDRSTLTTVDQPPTVLYDGPCRVRPRDQQDRVVDFGDTPTTLQSYIVSVPMSVVGISIDTQVVLTASTLDPDLLGQRMRVRLIGRGSQITARRLICELVDERATT